MNLFESGSTDIEVIKHERWSTRVNIVLLVAILCIIATYTGLGNQTTYVIVKNPSYKTFLSLESMYPNTLQCPCSVIAIKYDTFVQLQPTFHQVMILLHLIMTVTLCVTKIKTKNESDIDHFLGVLEFVRQRNMD